MVDLNNFRRTEVDLGRLPLCPRKVFFLSYWRLKTKSSAKKEKKLNRELFRAVHILYLVMNALRKQFWPWSPFFGSLNVGRGRNTLTIKNSFRTKQIFLH